MSTDNPFAGVAAQVTGEVTQTDVAATAEMLVSASSVVIVPGYGLAVAKGQYPLSELVKILAARQAPSVQTQPRCAQCRIFLVLRQLPPPGEVDGC